MRIKKADNTVKKLSLLIKAVSITLIFGAIYLIVARYYGDPLDPWMSYYFSLITQTTLGYDWYLPKRGVYYLVNSIQLVTVWLYVYFDILL